MHDCFEWNVVFSRRNYFGKHFAEKEICVLINKTIFKNERAKELLKNEVFWRLLRNSIMYMGNIGCNNWMDN